jgi:hypothetical protein
MFSKRVLIIGVIIISIVIVVVAIVFTLQQNSTPKEEFQLGRRGERSDDTSTQNPQFTDGHTDEYTVSYPTNWEASQAEIAGGGTNTSFAIPGDDGTTGQVTIQGVSADEAPLNQVEGVFEGLGYKKAFGNIQGAPATRYVGSVNNIQEVAYVFQKDTTVYTMILSYTASQPNEDLEKQFTQMVDTFTFN